MNISKTLIVLLLVVAGSQLHAQKAVETSFEVGGVCGMCEARIEKAVDVKGVKTADYDLDTHILTIVYSPKKITEEQIHDLLNAVGHDTEKSKASDEEYDGIHDCCKYREHENH